MTPPKISVVIPSFNKVKFIRETLDSIFSQKYPNLELIIQDGESTDGTLEIIKNYASKFPKNLKWKSEKDNGQLDAINRGLKKAKGDILTYINADDIYAKGAFNFVADVYSKNPGAVWFAGKGIVIDEKNQEIAKPISLYKSVCLQLNLHYLLLTFNYLMQPSIFFTREAYRKYGPFTGTTYFVMEYDFWLKLGAIKMPVVINKVLSKFRIEPGTKTMQSFHELLMEDSKIVKKHTNNILILFLHDLHNFGRTIVEKFI